MLLNTTFLQELLENDSERVRTRRGGRNVQRFAEFDVIVEHCCVLFRLDAHLFADELRAVSRLFRIFRHFFACQFSDHRIENSRARNIKAEVEHVVQLRNMFFDEFDAIVLRVFLSFGGTNFGF